MTMQLGVVFPQTEIGTDPGAVRDYAQAAEALGYEHLLVFDHVLGGEPRDGRTGGYNHLSTFHEPFVLFGYLAGLTQRIELVTGILILPQRQTALVAKQAAEADLLSGGRLRLGVAVGRNEIEYEGLNENFHNRGRRIVEQIEVMRKLWAEPVVDFKGRYHSIPRAAINPRPPRETIPIWMGGTADVVIKRIAKYADGWFLNTPLASPRLSHQYALASEEGKNAMDKLRRFAQEAGRDVSEIGIETRINFARSTPEDWLYFYEADQQFGATHTGVNTMNAGLTTPGEHIDAIRRVKEALDAGLKKD
jgi:probable F420-dependent oxidoreductase